MTASKLYPLILVACLARGVTPVRAQVCRGDCDGDGSVAVEELVVGVRIALGDLSPTVCTAVDADGDGAVSVAEVLAAVRGALDGCPAIVPSASPTPTATAVPTPVDPAALASAARLGAEPLFRVFDLQESLTAAIIVAARARRTARGDAADISGCVQLDCELFGTQEICCGDGEFTQTFHDCTARDAGGPGTLNGRLAIASASAALCSGAIPTDISFTLTLDGFTHDIATGDGGLFRSFHQLTERYDHELAACPLSNPDVFGFAVRGSGGRLLDGLMQRSEVDAEGHVITNLETAMHGLRLAVGTQQAADDCAATVAVTGALSAADFRTGTQFAIDFDGFNIDEDPRPDGTLLLALNGTMNTDCAGDISFATTAPLRAQRSARRCFIGGALTAQLGDASMAATYGDNGAVALDLDGDGTADQQRASCTDIPLDACGTNAIGLCGACTSPHQCQRGLTCAVCTGDCTGEPQRCSFPDASAPCEDGVF